MCEWNPETGMGARQVVLDRIFGEIERELQRQHSKGRDADDHTRSVNDWVAYITCFAGRAAATATNEKHQHNPRQSLMQVAALAVAAVRAHDARVLGENPEPESEGGA